MSNFSDFRSHPKYNKTYIELIKHVLASNNSFLLNLLREEIILLIKDSKVNFNDASLFAKKYLKEYLNPSLEKILVDESDRKILVSGRNTDSIVSPERLVYNLRNIQEGKKFALYSNLNYSEYSKLKKYKGRVKQQVVKGLLLKNFSTDDDYIRESISVRDMSTQGIIRFNNEYIKEKINSGVSFDKNDQNYRTYLLCRSSKDELANYCDELIKSFFSNNSKDDILEFIKTRKNHDYILLLSYYVSKHNLIIDKNLEVFFGKINKSQSCYSLRYPYSRYCNCSYSGHSRCSGYISKLISCYSLDLELSDIGYIIKNTSLGENLFWRKDLDPVLVHNILKNDFLAKRARDGFLKGIQNYFYYSISDLDKFWPSKYNHIYDKEMEIFVPIFINGLEPSRIRDLFSLEYILSFNKYNKLQTLYDSLNRENFPYLSDLEIKTIRRRLKISFKGLYGFSNDKFSVVGLKEHQASSDYTEAVKICHDLEKPRDYSLRPSTIEHSLLGMVEEISSEVELLKLLYITSSVEPYDYIPESKISKNLRDIFDKYKVLDYYRSTEKVKRFQYSRLRVLNYLSQKFTVEQTVLASTLFPEWDGSVREFARMVKKI